MTKDQLIVAIAANAALITQYNAAITAVLTGGVQEYTLNTSQTRQTVIKLNLKQLRDGLDSLYSQCAVLNTRLNGNGVILGGPAW